jgi:hypothetical protein
MKLINPRKAISTIFPEICTNNLCTLQENSDNKSKLSIHYFTLTRLNITLNQISEYVNKHKKALIIGRGEILQIALFSPVNIRNAKKKKKKKFQRSSLLGKGEQVSMSLP